jgi:hypothetical protein
MVNVLTIKKLLTLGWSFVLIVANESLDQNKVFCAGEKKIGSEK